MEINPAEMHSKNTANGVIFTDELETSILSTVTSEFVSQACNVPKRLYCPFCLFDFGFEFLLKSHIRNTHTLEIERFSRTKLHSFKVDTCSYCHAKFFIDGLLPKHVIRKHYECILNIVSTFDSAENVCCNFCSYRTSLKQMKLLFIHMENKHLDSFGDVLSAYRSAANGIISVSNQNSLKTVTSRSETVESLNNATNEKSTPKDSVKLKPILKKGSLYVNSPANLRIVDGNYASSSVKKIHFNLPDDSLSSTDGDKENFPIRNIGERVLDLKIKKMSKKSIKVNARTINTLSKTRNILGDITDSLYESNCSSISEQPGSLNLQALPFKCGVCSEKFCNNFILRHHIKKKHSKIHYHPRYKCGLCKAKFFRNNYLIRHNKLHHK